MTVNYDRLPAQMRDGARLYVEMGIGGDSFLTAVLSNKLVKAFDAADDSNIYAMREWARWLYNEAPCGCWGSKKKVAAWISAGGLAGLKRIGSEA
jgi:hypothetical protein